MNASTKLRLQAPEFRFGILLACGLREKVKIDRGS
jgi:hypothetical protein